MALNDSSVCYLISQLPYTSAVSYARLWQKHAFFFVRYGDRTRHEITDHMNTTGIKQQQHVLLPL